jgi:hypothetical protein
LDESFGEREMAFRKFHCRGGRELRVMRLRNEHLGVGKLCPKQNHVRIDPPATMAMQECVTEQARVNRGLAGLGELADDSLGRDDIRCVPPRDP